MEMKPLDSLILYKEYSKNFFETQFYYEYLILTQGYFPAVRQAYPLPLSPRLHKVAHL